MGAYGRPFDMEIAKVTRDACTDHVLGFQNSEQLSAFHRQPIERSGAW
jgi:hypothetical protein